jgi:UDP-N-acetylglucosamine--N-acetylmuramyl-(pentapeptide) pyrophosphoryl-undecaprenol N-acetylglucosamine transferase
MIFTGGGTGGHLYPALAVADAVKALDPEVDVLFVGTPDRIEARVVPEAGYRFEAIAARGLSKQPLEAAKALTMLVGAVAKARRLIGRERPKVVFGTGGYVSAPVLLAARLAGIPVVLQEQNVFPGKVNLWIARWANVVATSFPGSERYFSRKDLLMAGNPIRMAAFERTPAEAKAALGLPPDAKLLLVTGGSQGARRINEAVAGLMPRILAETDWHVMHVAGPNNTVQASDDPRYRLLGYCEQMPDAILASSLVISRAGATTLAELTAVGRPMLLVPYPYAGGHQRLNAEAIVAEGAGIEITDEAFTVDKLAETLLPLLGDRARLDTMAAASKRLGHPTAALELANVLLGIANAP